MVPVWDGRRYHLRGNYCSWNCAKSDALLHARAGTFPHQATALTLFVFQITVRGKHCPHKTHRHPSSCLCFSRFAGILAAAPRETLEAFGGKMSIEHFRRNFLTIERYEWIQRLYIPTQEVRETGIPKKYLYTLQPRRGIVVLENSEEEDDPVALIKRRAW